MVRKLTEYAPLPAASLQPGATFARPTQHLPERIRLDSPAVEVMTDLKQVSAATIDPGETIETANRVMIKRGVRLLLAMDWEYRVLGLITATDILGEKPLQYIRDRGVKRSDILVRDIMTPQERLEVLTMDDVLSAKVGHIISTLRKSGRQHALVVDVETPHPNDLLVNPSLPKFTHLVRGIFSASQIARQLGVPIQTTEVARTFAEIEAMLSH
ncbi:MAG: CBS domain-containing protein [Betaproteobacteria bacterium]|nr:CBS domain-containing protein [Betaproteobacteria bacterium]